MAGVPGQANQTLVESKRQLVDYIESGNKPKQYWRVGTEHEKFGFRWSDKQALPYDGPAGIRAVLNGMKRFGWEPVSEGDNVIALKQDGASITLSETTPFAISPGDEYDHRPDCTKLKDGPLGCDSWATGRTSRAGSAG